MKGIFKEIVIVLLMFLAAIFGILALLFEYIPLNKVIPEEIEYKTSQKVKDILQNSAGISEENVILTYTLDQDELYKYQAAKDYKPGKVNPFSSYQSKEDDDDKDDDKDDDDKDNPGEGGSGGGGKQENTISSNTVNPPERVNPGNYTSDKGLK